MAGIIIWKDTKSLDGTFRLASSSGRDCRGHWPRDSGNANGLFQDAETGGEGMDIATCIGWDWCHVGSKHVIVFMFCSLP